ncbi:hypothetical protein T09_3281 [Trichinella sp. T9]|nr:hypothetical protein T09_3281 [Trichinella sp. T9]
MTFIRFSVEPIMPTFQVAICPKTYITYIPMRQSFITANGPVVPASSRLTPVSTCGTGRKAVARSILISAPAHRLSYVPPWRSGSSNRVPAYSGSSPESGMSRVLQNHKLLFVD